MGHQQTSVDAGRRSRLTLLSTDACSACDAATDLLLSMPELQGQTLRVVEVSERADWVERYGERVPVLLVGDQELGWPFDAKSVLALFAAAIELDAP